MNSKVELHANYNNDLLSLIICLALQPMLELGSCRKASRFFIGKASQSMCLTAVSYSCYRLREGANYKAARWARSTTILYLENPTWRTNTFGLHIERTNFIRLIQLRTFKLLRKLIQERIM